MSSIVKVIMVLAVVIGSIAAVTAGFIVIALHGGFTSNNMGALGLLITTITTLGATIINLVRTEQLTAKVTNGLIPEKIVEGITTNQAQSTLTSVIEPIVAKHIEPVVDSLTAPPEQPGDAAHPIGGSTT